MDTLLLNTKRKKRKTRKCLDEIRKRSRSTSISGDPSTKKLQQVCNISNLKGCKRSNNCITSNRLTLTMFAKAVRSETITRPLLSDIKNPALDLKTPDLSPINKIIHSRSSGESTPKICNALVNARQSDEQFCHGSKNSPDSMSLFSPVPKVESRIFRESANEETISTITSTIRSAEDIGYHLYEELIEDIPVYLKRNLPNLIKDYVMNKTKTSLQNMYFESLQKQYQPYNNEACVQENDLTSDRSCTSHEIIIQNPMDYIKIGWRQSFQHSCNDSSPSNEEASPPQTPNTLSSPVVSPQQLHSVVPYTPDYEYYPHRLNE